MTAATTFLSDTYAFEGYSLARGLGLGNVVVGRQTESDTLNGTEGVDFIHGGGRNDTIYLSQSSSGVFGFSSDLIDGGTGFDTLAASDSAGQYDYNVTVVLQQGYDGTT